MLNSEKKYLHLRIFVPLEKQSEFFSFLEKAKRFYEKPGGISVKLYREDHHPEKFIEVIEYDNKKIFDEDQLRVENDHEMKSYLNQWRTMLSAVVEVESYTDITEKLENNNE